MKKILLKIITALTLVGVLVFSAVGCDLVEVNVDRDMQQIVATVKNVDGYDTTTSITKRDLLSAYRTYGYLYEYYYGMSTAEIYDMLIDNLITNAIVVQKAKKDLADGDVAEYSVQELDAVLDELKGDGTNYNYLCLLASDDDIAKFDSDNAKAIKKGDLKKGSASYRSKLADYVYTKYHGKDIKATDSPFRFVDSSDIYSALLSSIEGINSYIDSALEIEEDEAPEVENISVNARAVPTKEEDEEKDITTIDEVRETKILENAEDKRGIAKVLKNFKKNSLIDEDEVNFVNGYDDVSVLFVSYFRKTVLSTIESSLVSKYEEALKEKNKNSIKENKEALWNEYCQLKNAQKNKFVGDVGSLETALGNVSDSSFVVYNSGYGYGYVSHFLIPFTSEQLSEVNAFLEDKTLTQTQIDEYLLEMGKKVIAYDLRDSWVRADYGVYNNDGTFTFDNKYLYTYDDNGTEKVLGEELATFNGTIGRATVSKTTEDEKEVYKFNYFDVVANPVKYEDFCALVDRVLGTSGFAVGQEGTLDDTDDVIKTFENLKFAYSTDTGNLNKYFGYLYSPITSSTQYVSAFYDAAKEVVEKTFEARDDDGIDDNPDKLFYKVVVSKEYGLEIVLCTEIEGYCDYTETEFYDALEDENSVAYKFMTAVCDKVNSINISNISTGLFNTYNNSSYVTKYEKTYVDLLG